MEPRIPSRLPPYGARVLDEPEVEEWFGLTSSKLRVAQKIGLVESILAPRHGKYARAWDVVDVAKVYGVNSLSTHLALPFQAICDLVVRMEQSMGQTIVDTLNANPDDVWVFLYDRVILSYKTSGDEVCVGYVDTRDDGRTTFVPRDIDLPEVWASRCAVNLMNLRRRFVSLLKDGA